MQIWILHILKYSDTEPDQYKDFDTFSRERRGVFYETWPCSLTCCELLGSSQNLWRTAGDLWERESWSHSDTEAFWLLGTITDCSALTEQQEDPPQPVLTVEVASEVVWELDTHRKREFTFSVIRRKQLLCLICSLYKVTLSHKVY